MAGHSEPLAGFEKRTVVGEKETEVPSLPAYFPCRGFPAGP